MIVVSDTSPLNYLALNDRRAFLGWLLYTEIVKIWLDVPDAALKQLMGRGKTCRGPPWKPLLLTPTE